jgi:uncharacterized membrane protein
MFFAHFSLRPAANRLLDPPLRLAFLVALFDRFFAFVWVSVVLLWVSGLWVFVGLAGSRAGAHVHVMMGTALVMTGLFAFIWLVPFKAMKVAVAGEDWNAAGARLAVIRRLVLTNLLLGLGTAVLGSAGPALLIALTA